MNGTDANRSLREQVGRVLGDANADLDAEARLLARDHGERTYAAFLHQLLGRELTAAEARTEWEEAVALRQRMADELGEPVPLVLALVQVAARKDPRFRAGRFLTISAYHRMEESSTKDALTGLYNRRYFRDAFYRELKRSKRYRHPLSVILFDLDDFKSYNDANGHLAGDAALEETARLLLATCREIDVVCRYGGEEFVLILPATDKNGARILGEKIRRRIEEHPFPGEENCPAGALTLSGGISTFPEDGLTGEELLGNADESLYQAKKFIKNAVCYYFREDRRAYPRIEKEYELRYRLGKSRGWHVSRTRDISQGGLSFLVEGKAPALGTETVLEIRARGEQLQLKGRVVRVERYEEKGPYTIGVAFSATPEEIALSLAEL